MIFIDCDVVLLVDSEIILCLLQFDTLYMTQCAMIRVGLVANFGNILIKRLLTFFFKFLSAHVAGTTNG